MNGARRGGLVAVMVGVLGWCLALGALLDGDPLLAFELALTALAGLWAAIVARDLMRSHRLASALTAESFTTSLFGVPCRITSALGADAIVAGSARPRIFIGSALLATLSDDELRAVIYHEDHHRRTRAPIRAAALEAWLRLLGNSARARGIISDRLADLETDADADAIRRGSSARSLARALVKGGTTLQPVSFAYASDRRVGQLLDLAEEGVVPPARRLPYEWVPAILLGIATLGCHIAF